MWPSITKGSRFGILKPLPQPYRDYKTGLLILYKLKTLHLGQRLVCIASSCYSDSSLIALKLFQMTIFWLKLYDIVVRSKEKSSLQFRGLLPTIGSTALRYSFVKSLGVAPLRAVSEEDYHVAI